MTTHDCSPSWLTLRHIFMHAVIITLLHLAALSSAVLQGCTVHIAQNIATLLHATFKLYESFSKISPTCRSKIFQFTEHWLHCRSNQQLKHFWVYLNNLWLNIECFSITVHFMTPPSKCNRGFWGHYQIHVGEWSIVTVSTVIWVSCASTT